ncbi:hypothetical protein BaRGS_00014028 [Batillaria attramentaria]|uniref:Uncharacterized protein n=1 Tax=Batillaria attramentaria TaxID=370345 RepID=A0ABD0L5E3_9CAEN
MTRSESSAKLVTSMPSPDSDVTYYKPVDPFHSAPDAAVYDGPVYPSPLEPYAYTADNTLCSQSVNPFAQVLSGDRERLGLFFLLFIGAFMSAMWRRHVYMQRNRVFATQAATIRVHTTHASAAYPAPPGGTNTVYPTTVIRPHGVQQPLPPGQLFSYTQPQPPPYGFNVPPNPPTYSNPAYPPPSYSNPPPSYQSATAPGMEPQPADPFAQAAAYKSSS